VTWESKLHAAGSSAGQATFGYEWVLLLGRCQQSSCAVVAKGSCFSLSGVEGGDAGGVLQPWVWTSHEAELDPQSYGLQGDALLLAARPKSLYEGAVAAGASSDDVFGQLEVLCRGVKVAAAHDSHKIALPPAPSADTMVFAVHNPAHLVF
jgi:hypothetical protein